MYTYPHAHTHKHTDVLSRYSVYFSFMNVCVCKFVCLLVCLHVLTLLWMPVALTLEAVSFN